MIKRNVNLDLDLAIVATVALLVFCSYLIITNVMMVREIEYYKSKSDEYCLDKHKEYTFREHELLVNRILTLESVLIMEAEDRHQWVILDLNNRLVKCQKRPLVNLMGGIAK